MPDDLSKINHKNYDFYFYFYHHFIYYFRSQIYKLKRSERVKTFFRLAKGHSLSIEVIYYKTSNTHEFPQSNTEKLIEKLEIDHFVEQLNKVQGDKNHHHFSFYSEIKSLANRSTNNKSP